MAFLLEPLNLGSLSLVNRLVMPPMATSKAEADGKVSQAILDYYAEKSKGGYLSLIIIEHSFISQQGKASKGQLSVAEDSVVENLKTLAEVIHRNGSKTVMQINHAGSATEKEVTGTIPVGPSAVVNPRKMSGIPKVFATPHALTGQEIAEIVAEFQNAARRAKEAGFDGVEIHSAHGYLLDQFFSPLSNKRTDDYGGTLLNRIRIHLEIIKAVRETVGDDFPILLRLGAADYIEGGVCLEDSVKAAREFEKAGVDILDISGGFCGYTIPGSVGEQGYFAPLTEAIKKEVSIPVILTGGITQAEAAEQLLADGKADLIGVGRAILKDSDWAKHTIENFK
ncbi:NADH:flavin oxidoreductase [Desulfosporosinus sp. SB140]|uniref:NADH:flavin oxidoreductase n=1 Tax=Desulfosporosinus paludis TaxID=3115649 RepID=UPI00388F8C8A